MGHDTRVPEPLYHPEIPVLPVINFYTPRYSVFCNEYDRSGHRIPAAAPVRVLRLGLFILRPILRQLGGSHFSLRTQIFTVPKFRCVTPQNGLRNAVKF